MFIQFHLDIYHERNTVHISKFAPLHVQKFMNTIPYYSSTSAKSFTVCYIIYPQPTCMLASGAITHAGSTRAASNDSLVISLLAPMWYKVSGEGLHISAHFLEAPVLPTPESGPIIQGRIVHVLPKRQLAGYHVGCKLTDVF